MARGRRVGDLVDPTTDHQDPHLLAAACGVDKFAFKAGKAADLDRPFRLEPA